MALSNFVQSYLNPTGGTAALTLGGARARVTNITLDNSYRTGGYALTTQQLGLGHTTFASCDQVFSATGGVCPVAVNYNPSTGRLLCYSATGQIAAGTDLSTVTVQILAIGY